MKKKNRDRITEIIALIEQLNAELDEMADREKAEAVAEFLWSWIEGVGESQRAAGKVIGGFINQARQMKTEMTKEKPIRRWIVKRTVEETMEGYGATREEAIDDASDPSSIRIIRETAKLAPEHRK